MKRSQIIILILIIALGIFFRTYKLVERADFGHDSDLYSWIVKDIVVNKHFRLVGQETSAPGIFIGPLFYYLLIPFFLLSKMDPIGTIYFSVIVSLLTITSLYFVLSKLFKREVGLIGTYLYAVLLTTVNADRWIVPTITANLWVIWYFYCVVSIVRGNYKILPLLGILIGLIWHVHIALLPVLTAVPVAILMAKKLPNFSQIAKFSLALFIISLPLIIFEIKHEFKQTLSLFYNFFISREGAAGWYKFEVVIGMITKNINSLFFAPQSFKILKNFLFPLLILGSAFWLVRKKLIKINELIPLYVWVISVVLFFSISSSPISEYYINNIEIIFLTVVSFLFYILYISSAHGKAIVLGILVMITFKNAFFIVTQDTYHKGYIEKKATVDYIINDAKKKNFPCFSINYITSPGENVGFRYFFFLKKAHIAVAGRGSPVYNIVIPDEYSFNEVKVKFGHIGIIPPKESPPKDLMTDACSGQNTNLTDPLFGFVN